VGAVVSSSASYTFTASANRTLVANFVSTTHGLEISSATAIYNRGKVYVTVTFRNNGDSVFEAVTIGKKKETTLDGKASHENRPIVLGNMVPGDTETAILTFTGVKSGTPDPKGDADVQGAARHPVTPVEVQERAEGPPVHTVAAAGR
jgi:archaellum component FlaF (FlaF/FlaG flagellin family)